MVLVILATLHIIFLRYYCNMFLAGAFLFSILLYMETSSTS